MSKEKTILKWTSNEPDNIQKKLEVFEIPWENKRFIEGAIEISQWVWEVKNALQSKTNTEGKKFRTENYRSIDLNDKKLREITHDFCFTFCNPPYNQYAFFPSERPLRAISPSEVFKTSDSHLVDYDTLYWSELPVNPETWERAVFWHHPEATFQVLKERLKNNWYLTEIRDEETNKLCGFACVYEKTLKELFYIEEWRNPTIFSWLEIQDLLTPEDMFFEQMKNQVWLNPEDKVIWWWGIFTTPEARWLDKYLELHMNIYNLIPKEKYEMIALAEMAWEWTAYKLYMPMCKEILWAIANYHSISAITIKDAHEKHNLSKRNFVKLQKTFIEERKLWYNPRKSDNPNVQVQEIEWKWRAVFAKKDIKQMEIIAKFEWPIYKAKKISDLPNLAPFFIRDHVIQVWENEFLHGKDCLAELINHSCNPNCWIKDKSNVVAMRDIKKWEEIIWDYEMSEDSDWIMENCQCWSDICRWIIRAYRFMPEPIKQKYKKEWMISEWLIKKYN